MAISGAGDVARAVVGVGLRDGVRLLAITRPSRRAGELAPLVVLVACGALLWLALGLYRFHDPPLAVVGPGGDDAQRVGVAGFVAVDGLVGVLFCAAVWVGNLQRLVVGVVARGGGVAAYVGGLLHVGAVPLGAGGALAVEGFVQFIALQVAHGDGGVATAVDVGDLEHALFAQVLGGCAGGAAFAVESAHTPAAPDVGKLLCGAAGAAGVDDGACLA